MKKMLTALLCLILCLLMLPVTAIADSDGEQPAVITDSDHEMLVDPNPKVKEEESPLMRPLLAAKPDADPLACTFIANTANREYMERMIDWYLDTQPSLKTTLADGFSVLMFFEGGSDNVDTASYSDLAYRDGAVVIILQDDGAGPYIAGYCENCNTMPDYPMGYEYDNGHPGYGTATLIDGVYDLYTVNHRGTHAGFSVHMQNGLGCVPCVYMHENGSFALLNGTGVNVHGRMRDTVSGDVKTPISAGCLTVGDDGSFTEYNEYLNTAVGKQFKLIDHTYDGTDIETYRYQDWDDARCLMTKAAAMVLDRYLAKDHMMGIYESREVVEYITAFSTASQCDTDNVLASATNYPAYLTLTLSSSTDVKQLPLSSATTLGAADATLTATALYEVEGDYWYRVQFRNGTGYVPAAAVDTVATKYDDLSAHNFNWPTEKTYGNAFSTTGILSTSYNRYTKVFGIISDKDGTPECTAVHPDSGEDRLYTYSINASDGANGITDSEGNVTWLYSTLDNKLAFSGLAQGRHQYLVKAVVKNYYVGPAGLTWEEKEVEILKKDFTVVPIAITKGMDSKWVFGASDGLTFVSNMSCSRFSTLKIDGQEIDNKEEKLYTTSTDSPLEVTISTGLLKMLRPGPHTLTIVGSYGNAETRFWVMPDSHRSSGSGGTTTDTASTTVTSAPTGDAGLMSLCLSGMLSGAGLILLKKKK